jgi:hypothetical protein
MEFSMTAKVVLTLDHTPGEKTSKHVSTDFNLEVSDPLDPKMYLENGIPNAEGTRSITNLLIQGLIGNIHAGDKMGYRDSASHLRYVIGELERGVFTVADTKKSFFGNGGNNGK